MKELQPTTKYRKDLKRYRHQPQKLAALKRVLYILQNEQPIPPEYYPHMLHGDYEGCMECHIGSDFLLIWINPDTELIELVRLGTHSELFGR
ncbi:MAG: type II toxin-antitoxin system YafQ family toxin [Bacteroidales bacterium]|nr:type II toxin-antitoxin system YafQ family toxin [Bacteroidales bacterium]